MARLGDICEISAGQGAPQGENNYCSYNEGIPFIKAGDLSDLLSGKPENEIQCVNDIVAKHHKLKLYPAGSILFAKSGMSCMKGYVYRTQAPCYIVSHLAIVIPKNIDGEYLKYYFQYNRPNALIKDSAYPSISLQDISNIELTLPSLESQRSVASKLNKLNNLISLRKQQLSRLNELVKSRFVELFGDGHDGKTQLKMLGSICKFQQGTQIPVEEQFEEQISGYKRFLRIIDYTQAPQPPRYVNVNGKEVDEKSVVIVRYGATAGFVGRGYQGILANNLFEIMPDETILSKDFLFLALKYGTFEEEVHTKAFGAAMPALSFSMMNDIPVVVPVMEQQQQFVSFVEQIDKSKFEIQKSLEKLETLKKALMQKYFG